MPCLHHWILAATIGVCSSVTDRILNFRRPTWQWQRDHLEHGNAICHVLSQIIERKERHTIQTQQFVTWWRRQIETFSALLALCAGNSPVQVNSPHKRQWRGALMFSLIYAWINDWVNNREAGDLRRYRGHYDVNVMEIPICGRCESRAINTPILTDTRTHMVFFQFWNISIFNLVAG